MHSMLGRYLGQAIVQSAVAAVCLVLLVSEPFAAPRGSAVLGGEGLSPKLVSMLRDVSRQFGRPVIVSSGCRSKHGNRRAGGARRSFHLRCMAADIKVIGVSESRVLSAARGLAGRGGIGTYCRNSVVHIDVGPRREWHQNCGRKLRSKSKRSIVQYAQR
jgi:Peptidase M15